MKRITKFQANYKELAHKEKCRDCSMFKMPANCSLVIGYIALNGHCDYWKADLPVERDSA